MKPLKNQIITFRVDEEIKTKIEKMAKEKEWSISQVVERICKDYFKEKEIEVNNRYIATQHND